MHHKFCVIDRATVILGSYHWTKRAQDNDENIIVMPVDDHLDNGIVADYLNAFDAILCKYGLRGCEKITLFGKSATSP